MGHTSHKWMGKHLGNTAEFTVAASYSMTISNVILRTWALHQSEPILAVQPSAAIRSPLPGTKHKAFKRTILPAINYPASLNPLQYHLLAADNGNKMEMSGYLKNHSAHLCKGTDGWKSLHKCFTSYMFSLETQASGSHLQSCLWTRTPAPSCSSNSFIFHSPPMSLGKKRPLKRCRAVWRAQKQLINGLNSCLGFSTDQHPGNQTWSEFMKF